MVGAVRHRPAGPRALLAAAPALAGRGPPRRRRRALGPRAAPPRPRPALMIGLALVVAVNSLGASFLKSIEDEFDRSFARDLTVQPTGLRARARARSRRSPRSLRDRLAKLARGRRSSPASASCSRPNLPGAEGQAKLRRAAARLRARPSTSEVDKTEIDGAGASREEVFDALERGEVTVGKGHADETGARGRRQDRARRALGDRARPGRRDRRDGASSAARRSACRCETMRGRLRRHRRLRAGAEGDLADGRARRSSARSSRSSSATTRTSSVLSNEELKSDVEDAGQRAVRDLLRDRRRRDLRQPVRDRQHALDVGDRAHPRDRRPARARRLALAGAPPDRRRERRHRPDRRPARDRGRRRARLRRCSRASRPGSRASSTGRRWRRWSGSPSPASSSA